MGIRYSGVEWIDGGRELDETIRAAELFEKHGVCIPCYRPLGSSKCRPP